LTGSGTAKARQFLNERKAVVAVEFAIIGAPLLLMIVEIFQSALFVYNTSRLDAATHEAARQILTGSVQKGGQTAAQFRTNLCSMLPVTIPCGRRGALPREAAIVNSGNIYELMRA
jgi:Flp pilus assembly protein TadG